MYNIFNYNNIFLGFFQEIIRHYTTKNRCVSIDFFIHLRLFSDDEGLDFVHDHIAVCCARFQGDRTHKIKTENTHDGLSINTVSAADKVDVAVKCTNCFNKVTNIFDGAETNCYFHFENPLSMCRHNTPYSYLYHTNFS